MVDISHLFGKMFHVKGSLRIFTLFLICLVITGFVLLLFDALIALTSLCYLTDGCYDTPIVGTMGFISDVVGTLCFFAVFPLATIVRSRDFRKLKKSRPVTKALRIIFAMIPLFLFPLKMMLSNPFS